MSINTGGEQQNQSVFPSADKMWPPPRTEFLRVESAKKVANLLPLKKLSPQNSKSGSGFYNVLTTNKSSYKKGCQIDINTNPLNPQKESPNGNGIIPTKAFINIDFGSTTDVVLCEVVIEETINSKGEILGDIVDEIDIDSLLTNLFVKTKKGFTYAKFVGGVSRNLEYFLDYNPITKKREGVPEKAPAENSTGAEIIGAELDEIESKIARKTRIKTTLELLKIEGLEQAKPIEGIEREEIVKDALNSLISDTRGKISPERFKELETLASSGKILFLHQDEYSIFVGDGQSEEDVSAASAFGLTIDKDLILINQDKITTFPELKPDNKPSALNTYKLMRTSEGVQNKYDLSTIENAQKVLGDQIGYVFGIEKSPRDSSFNLPSDEEIQKELTKNLLWSIVYHESLHFAIDDTHFLSGLNEAATHYKTALATNKKLGKNAFCGYSMASGLEHAINWTAFLRTFPITEETADSMYYNPTGEWTIKKMFDSYPEKRRV